MAISGRNSETCFLRRLFLAMFSAGRLSNLWSFVSRVVPFVIGLLAFSIPFATRADVVIRDAWIREAPPTATNLAGYAVIENRGAKPVDIKSVTSDAFERVEIHGIEMIGGMMRMHALPRVVISPNDILSLEPGAKHLMLIKPKEKMSAGKQIEIRFTLSSGTVTAAKFVVVK